MDKSMKRIIEYVIMLVFGLMIFGVAAVWYNWPEIAAVVSVTTLVVVLIAVFGAAEEEEEEKGMLQ